MMYFASQPVEKSTLLLPSCSGFIHLSLVSSWVVAPVSIYPLSRVKKRKLKAGREGKGKPAVNFDTSIEGVVPTTYRWAPYHPNVGLKLVKVWQSL